MKSKKLLITSLFLMGGLGAFISLTSTSNASSGVMGASTAGCSCHGTASSATTIEITGIPASGFVAGTPYSMTLAVKNSTKAGAGFDLTCTSGTISGAPANTMLMMGTELHHTAVKDAVSGITTWSFTWTPAASGNSVTFNVAGNAVNKNNGDSGDQWAVASLTFNKAIPSSLKDIDFTGFSIYPNPTSSNLYFVSENDMNNVSFKAVSLYGGVSALQASKEANNKYLISSASLANGNYILLAESNGKTYSQTFSKN
jgi:hypothetical protein